MWCHNSKACATKHWKSGSLIQGSVACMHFLDHSGLGLVCFVCQALDSSQSVHMNMSAYTFEIRPWLWVWMQFFIIYSYSSQTCWAVPQKHWCNSSTSVYYSHSVTRYLLNRVVHRVLIHHDTVCLAWTCPNILYWPILCGKWVLVDTASPEWMFSVWQTNMQDFNLIILSRLTSNGQIFCKITTCSRRHGLILLPSKLIIKGMFCCWYS